MPIASSLLNKPRLVKKLKDFYDYVNKNDGKVGTKTRGIDLNFNNACNLRCKYCFTNSPKGDHVKEYLDYKAIARLADEADELGYFEFDLQGGELLLQPDKLFEVLEAIKPERFYMYLTTNGYYLDESMAKRLAEANEEAAIAKRSYNDLIAQRNAELLYMANNPQNDGRFPVKIATNATSSLRRPGQVSILTF